MCAAYVARRHHVLLFATVHQLPPNTAPWRQRTYAATSTFVCTVWCGRPRTLPAGIKQCGRIPSLGRCRPWSSMSRCAGTTCASSLSNARRAGNINDPLIDLPFLRHTAPTPAYVSVGMCITWSRCEPLNIGGDLDFARRLPVGMRGTAIVEPSSMLDEPRDELVVGLDVVAIVVILHCFSQRLHLLRSCRVVALEATLRLVRVGGSLSN